jgi:hypothetical protein
MLQSCVSYASGELHLVRSLDSRWILAAGFPVQYALHAPDSASTAAAPFFAPFTSH